MRKMALLAMVIMGLAGCSSTAERQSVSWGSLTMRIPKAWRAVEGENSLDIHAKSLGTLFLQELCPSAAVLSQDLSPKELLAYTVKVFDRPDPEMPETKVLSGYTEFSLPSGEPAAVAVLDLGAGEYLVDYLVAADAEIYKLSFYGVGKPPRELDAYQRVIESIAIRQDDDPRCSAAL